MARQRDPWEDGSTEDFVGSDDLTGDIVQDQPQAPPQGGGGQVQTPWGAYPDYDMITDAEAGDPRYNQRQSEFEANTDWGGLEATLRREAEARGIEYDPSDLAGIQRNAGYDRAHLGGSDEYGEAIQKFLGSAISTYDDRKSNTPGGADTRSGVSMRSPGGSGGGSGGQGNFRGDLMGQLRGLWPDGGYNQDIVNRRLDNTRSDLNRFRKSQGDTNRAMLANRGLLSEGVGHESGPEYTSMRMLDENVADRFADAASGIYADESANADERMMQALQLSAGLSSDDARLAVDQFRADTERMGVGNQYQLGLGNLALGNSTAANNYNLGLANFGLDRDKYLNDSESQDIEQLIQVIEELIKQNQIGAGGFN